MPLYITAAEVRERLLGKVRFTNDDTDENAVSSGFLEQLIEEAEGEVETRLSVRYEIPFVGENNEAFTDLPQTTRVQIKALCRMEAVRRILLHDFGRGTAAEGENYYKGLHQDYEDRLDRLIVLRDNSFNMFKYPPLPTLRLAAHNSEADDGYAGMILVTSDEYGGGAARQMPSPGETVWNGRVPEK
jgi:hypothetical protein